RSAPRNDGIVLSLRNSRSSLRGAERQSNPENENRIFKVIHVYETTDVHQSICIFVYNIMFA
ncbi:MAG: hypothetical protein LBF54_01225, partial [Holosporaceae bacterium]|nr:hypothetical protein [Holosporaceae bacterium]